MFLENKLNSTETAPLYMVLGFLACSCRVFVTLLSPVMILPLWSTPHIGQGFVESLTKPSIASREKEGSPGDLNILALVSEQRLLILC